MTIASSTTALANAIAAYGAAVIARRKAGGQLTGAAYTKPTVVAFTAAPTFDASTSNVFQFGALTNNVPGVTISNPADGQTITIRFQQDAVGGRTVTLPGTCQVSGSVAVAANAITLLTITYDAVAAKWEGSWVPVQ